MRTLLWSLVRLIYPSPDCCPLCGHPGGGPGFCADCRRRMVLHTDGPHCKICGRFFITPVSGNICRFCRPAGSSRRRNRAVGPHEGIFKEMVHALKYRRRLALAAPMGRMMAALLRSDPVYDRAGLLVPVPLGNDRLRERRFNQALLLAREISSAAGLPMVDALVRTARTAPQTGLDAPHRRRNVRGAFSVVGPRSVQGRVVVLVDDVFTTGSTIAEAARVLSGAGARRVLGLTFTAGKV